MQSLRWAACVPGTLLLALKLQIESEPAREGDKIKSLIMIKWFKKNHHSEASSHCSRLFASSSNRRTGSCWALSPECQHPPLLPPCPSFAHSPGPEGPSPTPFPPCPKPSRPGTKPLNASWCDGCPWLRATRPGFESRLCQFRACLRPGNGGCTGRRGFQNNRTDSKSGFLFLGLHAPAMLTPGLPPSFDLPLGWSLA